MLCFPGFTPVAKLAQATGDSEGWVVSSLEKAPSSPSFCRFGSLPSPMNFPTRVGSMPSKPMTNTFCLARLTGLPPSGPFVQPAPMRRARRLRLTSEIRRWAGTRFMGLRAFLPVMTARTTRGF